VRAVQLRLFPLANPLADRFGRDFMRRVPQKPGVYQMRGKSNQLLYVGQSRNLRQRLASYKNADPDKVPRKVTRLLHSVESIHWEVVSTPELARLRENELLRTHRTRFNVMNTYPKGYFFIGVRREENIILFSWGTELEANFLNFGSFKRRALDGFAGLLRLLWAVGQRPQSPFDFPSLLLRSQPPRRYDLDFAQSGELGVEGWWHLLLEFLSGSSCQLTAALDSSLPSADGIGTFHRNFRQSDLERAGEFFETGPKRNYGLRRHHSLTNCLILQEELDDLLVTLPRALGKSEIRWPKTEQASVVSRK